MLDKEPLHHKRITEIVTKQNLVMQYDNNMNFINPVTNTVWNSPGLYNFLPDAPYRDSTGKSHKYPYCMIKAPYEYYALYNLSKSVPKNGKILEIGTAWGGTSALMSRANLTAKIETWDPYIRDGNETWVQSWEIEYGRSWSYESTVDFLKNFPNIDAKKGFFPKNVDVSKWEYNSLDMVFEDSDHSHVSTLVNLFFSIPYVKKGGIVAGHDYNTGFPGVVDAVNKAHSIFSTGKLFLCDGLWFFYKK